MVEEIKNLVAALPNSLPSMMATFLPILAAVFLQSGKVKELQEIAERNINMINDVPPSSKAYELLEKIIVQDIERIKRLIHKGVHTLICTGFSSAPVN